MSHFGHTSTEYKTPRYNHTMGLMDTFTTTGIERRYCYFYTVGAVAEPAAQAVREVEASRRLPHTQTQVPSRSASVPSFCRLVVCESNWLQWYSSNGPSVCQACPWPMSMCCGRLHTALLSQNILVSAVRFSNLTSSLRYRDRFSETAPGKGGR